jgi:hypothetical protein
MKKKLLNLIFLAAAAISLQACMQTYPVGPRARFANQIMVETPSPSRKWVPGRYVPKGNRYVWATGDYQIPSRGRLRSAEGRWNHAPKVHRYQNGSMPIIVAGKRKPASGKRKPLFSENIFTVAGKQ